MTATPRTALLATLLLAGTMANADGHYDELSISGGVMLIDWRGGFSNDQRAKLRAWLEAVGGAVMLLHGALPRERIRIELTDYRGTGSPVPFARIRRTEPQGVEFFIDPTQPLDAFVTDWTAYHELSHLFIPYPGDADVWFSEGMASYYQNVLQYRAGLLTEREAWQKLYEGFERGRSDDRHDHLTLAQLTPRMYRKRAFMRVYWSGALYFLEADIKLRELGDGRTSLDSILREFGACCLESRRRWTGPEIAAEFDRIAGADVFLPLYRRYEASTAIPDFRPHLAAAGVEVRGERVVVAEPGFLESAETRMNAYAAGPGNHYENPLSYGSNKPLGNATELP